MKHIKGYHSILEKHYQNIYDKYFTIPFEDIDDILLELTDMGYKVSIEKKFVNLNSNNPTSEPLSMRSYPIYDIDIEKEYKDDDINYRYNGSYYYEEPDILSKFSSVVNKISKILGAKVYATSSNNRYMIRIVLDQINIDKVGFDFYTFSEIFSNFIKRSSAEYNIKIEDHWSGGNSIRVSLMSDKSKPEILKDFEKSDVIDNKDKYNSIKEDITEFLEKYKSHITWKISFSEEEPFHTKFSGRTIFSSPIPKRYNRFELSLKINKNETPK